MQKYKENRVQAMGDWLTSREWSHYATFTTGYELTVSSARRAMHRIHDSLDRLAPCEMFWAAEPFDVKEGYHTHALLKVHESMPYKAIVDLWQKVSKGGKGKWNRIDLQEYDSNRGAGYYLGKYITKGLSDYDYLSSGSSRGYMSNRK